MMKLNNSNCDATQKLYCDETQKLNKVVMQLKNSNCNETKKK